MEVKKTAAALVLDAISKFGTNVSPLQLTNHIKTHAGVSLRYKTVASYLSNYRHYGTVAWQGVNGCGSPHVRRELVESSPSSIDSNPKPQSNEISVVTKGSEFIKMAGGLEHAITLLKIVDELRKISEKK